MGCMVTHGETDEVTVVVEYGDVEVAELTFTRESVTGGVLTDDELMDMAESEVQDVYGPQADIQSVYIKDE